MKLLGLAGAPHRGFLAKARLHGASVMYCPVGGRTAGDDTSEVVIPFTMTRKSTLYWFLHLGWLENLQLKAKVGASGRVHSG